MSSLICDRWLTHKLATFWGLTDSLKCSFSCHDQRSVEAAGWTHMVNLLPEGRSLALAARGWTCSEPLSRGLAGSVAAQAGRMACCAVHLHSSGREHNLGLKPFIYYPSPRPFTPQRGETCRITLPIGRLAEGRHTHTQHTP